ncbi:MAG: glycosyltransferase family 87 protein, partial [Rhodospirillales bacterium]|nr:glycosyltransferase family 87 protein [Rhodospirillales bacterium]
MTGRQASRATEAGTAAALFTLVLLWDILLYVVQLSVSGAHLLSLPSGHFVHDFAFFWGGPRLFWLGDVARIFDPERFNSWLAGQIAPGSMQQFATWSYPPTMLLPLLPFGLLPLPVAFLAWLSATFALLAIVLRQVVGETRTIAAVMLSPAAFYCFFYGQNGALTAALLIAGLWLIDRRPLIAGACIGALVIKPQLGIVLPFALAAGGYWRAFAMAALVATLLVLATIPLVGLAAWQGFVQATMPAMTAQLMHAYGIPPQFAMPTTWVTLQGWGAEPRLAALGQGASTVMAVTIAVLAWRRPPVDRTLRNALTCVLPLLATPFGYVYDAIPTMLAVALIVRAHFAGRLRLTWWERPLLAGVWLLPALMVPWQFLLHLRPVGAWLLMAFALSLLWR